MARSTPSVSWNTWGDTSLEALTLPATKARLARTVPPANGGGTSYRGAAAVRCNAANEELGETDLTKETQTASDHPKCGTTSYTVGSNSYTYIGSRFNNGDKFRYWGQVVYGGTFFMRGPASVRCD